MDLKNSIELVLFDLGGVLVDLLESPIPVEHLHNQDKSVFAKWFVSEPAQLFEKGMINALEFASAMQKDLELDLSTDQIINYFEQFSVGLFNGVDNLLHELGGHYRLAVLTNTNEIHWSQIVNEFKVLERFEKVFASHSLKMAKPDIKIYQYVLKETNLQPNQILFLDDKFENVQSAQELGIHSVQVRGLQQVRQVLESLKLLNI